MTQPLETEIIYIPGFELLSFQYCRYTAAGAWLAVETLLCYRQWKGSWPRALEDRVWRFCV